MLGYTIIKTKRLKELEIASGKLYKVHELYRWFSGWKDLDVIWDYILDDKNFGGISAARDKYAACRGTDCYGVGKDENML